ncbi:indolepyruvate oxidoreductase subunit beta family protein [Bordetella pseudohinzii]|nr:indolepyruvate oxidoreductase subunit beta family protein [Bordetella pseudohinzii]
MTHPLKIAILAMGGQGGGVLADWLVDMAEHAGWWAQTTSVPGVAQRTGATIYYVELLPEAEVQRAGRAPALALMPTPGDVDLVVAAELMEGGRAIQRGLVTPERTVLISSSHRSYAVSEKSAPGNGIADPNKVLAAGREAARRFLCFDLQALADQAGSVISASLFGAMAGSGVLPFSREAFEATIGRAGVGVQASLRAFGLGFDAAAQAPAQPAAIDTARPLPEVPAQAAHPESQALLDRARRDFPAPALPLVVAGLRRLIDYQDPAYAAEYLDRLDALRALDDAARGWALTQAAARYVALAMSYDDVIRVADLKTRGSRFGRVRGEVGATAGQLVHTTEFMHPRLEEICGTLPARLGRWLEQSPAFGSFVSRRLARGRRLRSSTLGGFLALYGLAGMRRFRRATLRHRHERADLEQWLDLVAELARADYALAVEAVLCRRLVKGYSDTHVRGGGKYRSLLAAARALAGRPDAASRLKQLRETALADASCAPLERQMAELAA